MLNHMEMMTTGNGSAVDKQYQGQGNKDDSKQKSSNNSQALFQDIAVVEHTPGKVRVRDVCLSSSVQCYILQWLTNAPTVIGRT